MKMNTWLKMLNGDKTALKQETKEIIIPEGKIYRLSWQTGQKTNLLTHDETVRKINEWINRRGWDWIRITNTKTNKTQTFQEPKSDTRYGFHIKQLNENLL